MIIEDLNKYIMESIEFKNFYHGSNNKFNKFGLNYFGQSDAGWMGYGVYFTNIYDYAVSYADDNGYLYTVDLKLNNPLILTDDNYSRNPNRLRREYEVKTAKELTNKLRSLGYDSVVLRYDDEDTYDMEFQEVLVFDVDNIIIKRIEKINND